MKKKIVLLLILLLVSMVLIACVPKCPLSFSDARWVCEDPYIWFETHKGEYPAKGELTTEDGELLQIDVAFPTARIGFVPLNKCR